MKGYLITSVIVFLAGVAAAAGTPPVAPNGVAMIEGYRNWRVIAPSSRPDKGHIRLILGNELAVKSFLEGTRPFPNGAALAKVAWTTKRHPRFPVAVIPDKFVQVEFMVKDSVKYRATGGWGFARFVGEELKPYGKDAGFVQECYGCHMPMGDNDFLFTYLPSQPY